MPTRLDWVPKVTKDKLLDFYAWEHYKLIKKQVVGATERYPVSNDTDKQKYGSGLLPAQHFMLTAEFTGYMDGTVSGTYGSTAWFLIILGDGEIVRDGPSSSWHFEKEYHRFLVQVKIYPLWYRDWETDRKSTRLNSSHRSLSRMPSSA